MIRRALLLAAASSAFVSLAFGASPATAETLLIHGGPIHTGIAARPVVEAVVVRDGRIAFTGPLAKARPLAKGAIDIDLHGSAAYPGFVDAHAHLTEIGLQEMSLNLVGTASVVDLVQRTRAYVAGHPGADPVVGGGWIETHWPEHRFPTRADLDAVTGDRPVFLSRADGHAAIANSAMLKLAGIDRNTPDPAGGRIEKDAAGEPTGLLVDNALGLAGAKLPPVSPQRRREALERAVKLYASRGWTGAGFMSVEAEDIVALDAMAAEGKLPIRVDAYMDPSGADRVLAEGPYQDATGLVRVRGIKMYMDGALGSRGAALLAPYSDRPDTDGLLRTPHDVLLANMKRALKVHAQVATHAIGDRGNRLALNDYAEAFAADPADAKGVRWRIEHAQIVSPADLPRFARMGVIASMQPSHAIGDLYFAPARLGPERLKGAYAWNSLLKSGAVVAAGTDAPVEKGDPLIEFYAATWRHSLDGFADANWRLEEAVSRPQALRMLTWAPAYAAFHEGELGVLAPGKAADITAFSTDLMTAAPADILKAHAVLTVVGGKVVYRAP